MKVLFFIKVFLVNSPNKKLAFLLIYIIKTKVLELELTSNQGFKLELSIYFFNKIKLIDMIVIYKISHLFAYKY